MDDIEENVLKLCALYPYIRKKITDKQEHSKISKYLIFEATYCTIKIIQEI